LVKAIAYFGTYIFSTHVISYVPYSPVKILLNQQLGEGTWENRLYKLQEFDLEIKLMKYVKGKGLFKFVTGIKAINIYPPNTSGVVIQISALIATEWYKDIIFYLNTSQFPLGMYSRERKSLNIKTNQYVLLSGVLFRRNFDGILLICLDHLNSK
jgi:hypothetical protein